MRVECCITKNLFRRFAFFDAFIRQKKLRSIIIYLSIAFVFAVLSFVGNGTALGFVFIALGVLLPFVYLLQFALSVKKQLKRLDAASGTPAYTLELSEARTGIRVINGSGDAKDVKWENCFAVYKRSDCIYLYISPVRAFLLPIAENERELCGLLIKMLPTEKLSGF